MLRGDEEMQSTPCIVFRLYDRQDQPLFVGITQDWPQARRHLANHAPWFGEVWRTELEPCRSLLAALEREQVLIRELDPRYRPAPPPVGSDPGVGVDWLTVREAARDLGVSAGRVRQWLANGALAATETADGPRIYRGALAPLRRRGAGSDHVA
jgi:excisionase family DNA binding protein